MSGILIASNNYYKDPTTVTGEQSYTALAANSTTSFTVPANVFSICAVCIGGGASGNGIGNSGVAATKGGGGGGACAWVNNVSVTPGQVLTVGTTNGGNIYNGFDTYIDLGGGNYIVYAQGGQSTRYGAGGPGGQVIVGQGGGAGGTAGGNVGGYLSGAGGGGGGAGGYTGAGGNGGPSCNSANSALALGADGAGGGGGGGAGATILAGTATDQWGSGGGVGLFGIGANGVGGTPTVGSDPNGNAANNGTGGSNGTTSTNANGGLYGGGAGAWRASGSGTPSGSRGAVRIMWGPGRSFPSNAT